MNVLEKVMSRVEYDLIGGCHMWAGAAAPGGYGNMSIGGKNILVHRAVWAATNGDIPAGMVVRHKCDVPCCVNIAHLELGTPSDNMQDAITRGRFVVGPRPKNLSSDQIILIRDRLAVGWKDGQIATILGVSRNTVGRHRRALQLQPSASVPTEQAEQPVVAAKTAEDVAGEAYQVIGALAGAAGLFDHPEVTRALDYFSGDLTGEVLSFNIEERAG